MSRLIAYMGSDPERLQAALADHRDLLLLGVPQDGPKAGEAIASWGIGFYQGGEVLLQRRPRVPAGPIDLFEAFKDLRTDAFLAQMRPATPGQNAKNENTPPFRFRSWIMAHQGSIPAFDRLRDDVLRLVPDFLRRNIRGQTESEHLFHVFLASLHEAGRGQMEDANLPPDLALRALTHALGRLNEIVKKAGAGDDVGPLDVALTNGRSLIVLRRGALPLWLRRLGPISAAVGNHHEHFRGVVVLSGLAEAPAAERGFEEVPADHALLVGRDLALRIVPA